MYTHRGAEHPLQMCLIVVPAPGSWYAAYRRPCIAAAALELSRLKVPKQLMIITCVHTLHVVRTESIRAILLTEML